MRKNRTRLSLRLPALGSEPRKKRQRQLNRQCMHLSSPRVLLLRQNKTTTSHRHCELRLLSRRFGRSARRSLNDEQRKWPSIEVCCADGFWRRWPSFRSEEHT